MSPLTSNARAALLVASCLGLSSCAPGPTQRFRGKSEPEWVRTALEQSAKMMDDRCPDLAPLALVDTPDSTLAGCSAAAVVIAAKAWQRVYQDALSECVAASTRSSGGNCCFARVTDSAELWARSQIECDNECGRRTGRERGAAPPTQSCKSEMLSLPRRIHSRAHTTAVVAIVSRCQRGSDQSPSCDALPTHIERAYCSGYCEAERTKFNGSLLLCVRAAKDGARVGCNLDEPAVRQECEARCREQSGPSAN